MQATVRDVMSADVVTATCYTSIAQAAQILLNSHVDELFVVDKEGHLCGIVPDYELLKWRLAACPGEKPVEEVMSRRFLVIDADARLSVAERYLREQVHRRLAVVDGRLLIGQITRRSMLRWLTCQDEPPPLGEQETASKVAPAHRLDQFHGLPTAERVSPPPTPNRSSTAAFR